MNKIKELTQAIRNFAECDLDYGTLKTLKMIDNEADRLETKLQNTSSNSNYAKCADDIMKLFDVDYPDKSVIELTLKKHFA